MLRPYLRSHRNLLGSLRQASWETVHELIAEVTDGAARPGMVAALNTASSGLRWHPHVHALATGGGWDCGGMWHPVPYVDSHAAEMLFRQKVLSLRAGEGRLSEQRIELLDSWKQGHTGFSAHYNVTVAAGNGEGLERVGRYLLRPPLSIERMELAADRVHYRHKRAPYSVSETFDPEDFLARLLMHIPAPRLHQTAYYGANANVVRARRQAQQQGRSSSPL